MRKKKIFKDVLEDMKKATHNEGVPFLLCYYESSGEIDSLKVITNIEDKDLFEQSIEAIIETSELDFGDTKTTSVDSPLWNGKMPEA